MGRIALLVFLLVVLAFVMPQTRERMLPHLEPVLNPLHQWSAEGRVQDIARRIDRNIRLERPIPNERTLPSFLQREFGGADPTIDPWGSPYYLERVRDGIVVGSPGRDRERGTEHDIRSRPVEIERRR